MKKDKSTKLITQMSNITEKSVNFGNKDQDKIVRKSDLQIVQEQALAIEMQTSS